MRKPTLAALEKRLSSHEAATQFAMQALAGELRDLKALLAAGSRIVVNVSPGVSASIEGQPERMGFKAT
mgnify:FL=1